MSGRWDRFVEEATGRRLTFRAFNERADRFAEALGRLGVTPGARIAVLCHNSATFFEILMGCAKVGVILVPLNWRQTPAELAPFGSQKAAPPTPASVRNRCFPADAEERRLLAQRKLVGAVDHRFAPAVPLCRARVLKTHSPAPVHRSLRAEI